MFNKLDLDKTWIYWLETKLETKIYWNLQRFGKYTRKSFNRKQGTNRTGSNFIFKVLQNISEFLLWQGIKLCVHFWEVCYICFNWVRGLWNFTIQSTTKIYKLQWTRYISISRTYCPKNSSHFPQSLRKAILWHDTHNLKFFLQHIATNYPNWLYSEIVTSFGW